MTELLVIPVAIAVNAVFAAFEMALAAVSRARLVELAAARRRGAADALQMKDRVEASLAVIQVGITLAGVVGAAVGGAGAEELVAPGLEARFGWTEGTADAVALVLVVVPLTALTIIVGELVPKVFALTHTERVCLLLAPLMRRFGAVVHPAVWLLELPVRGLMRLVRPPRRDDAPVVQDPAAAARGIREAASFARALRLIGHREEQIILGAATLPTRPVEMVMTPMDRVITVSADATRDALLEGPARVYHTRLPVRGTRPGDPPIVGYLHVKDLLDERTDGAVPLRTVMRPLPEVPPGLAVTELLDRMLRTRTPIALVVAPDGAPLGLLSMEDILEELVGEIDDEFSHALGGDAARSPAVPAVRSSG